MASKLELEDELNEALTDIESVKEILEKAYTPEASREELAAAVGSALAVIEDYDEDEDDDEVEVDDEDDE